MVYRYLGNSAPRARFFMDCTLARSLVEAAPHWRSRGIVEVQDIGVYNYRCIGTGTPPDCPSGMSQHAYAKAIDLARFVHADDTTYTVETDWVIDPSTEPTCAATTEDAKDDWLHKLICALKGDDVWNIVLTPNYNSAHRDHFHVALTTGSDFIRGRAPMDHGPDDD
ncbi:MAG: extensin family protein [Myxococcales bacterium]|nr:extensin family protein [Myxococcales bacterium]